jgi:DCN1-like protein 1/2
MPPGYTSAQKAAITQFISFTNADKNTATRFLKSHNWNQEQAVNGFFSGAQPASNSSGSKSSLNKVFDKYREDPSTPDAINASGMMKYLGDIGVDIEDIGMLAVSEIVKSPAMGEMTREGFVDGWLALSYDTLDKQKSHVKNLLKNLPTSKDTFVRIYKHTFQLAKVGTQKTIQLEMATAYWTLLFSSSASAIKWSTPSNPWLEWWTEFLTTSWKRAVNKDVWNETLRFAQESLKDEALTFWSEEASWPSVIDEFVDFVKKKRGDDAPAEEMEE